MRDPVAVALLIIAKSDAIPDGLVVPFYLPDRKRRISIARVGGRLYGFDDLCTCGGAPCPLSGGLLTGTSLMCQCHGTAFDVGTGAVVEGRAMRPLDVYAVDEVEGAVRIRL